MSAVWRIFFLLNFLPIFSKKSRVLDSASQNRDLIYLPCLSRYNDGMEMYSPIEKYFRLTEVQKRGLKKLRLETIRDLLFHFPSRYSDITLIKQIKDVVPGEIATLYGTIKALKTRKTFRRKTPIGEALLEDPSGTIKVMWFNQPYIAKMVSSGQTVRLTGKVTKGSKGIYLTNPELEKASGLPAQNADSSPLQPIYPETRGLTSKWFYHAMKKIMGSDILDNIDDYISVSILKKYNLPTFRTALIWIHTPKKESDGLAAKKRFAFEEVFFIQLLRQHDRLEYKKNKSFSVTLDKADRDRFLSRFPFKPTGAQEKAIDRILKDMSENQPMSRLLEGDVGSGKTLVAAVASYAVINNRPQGQDFGNLQVAYMAPTEILANQHFESFIEYFSHLPINIGLITSSGCKKFPSKVNPEGWTTISRPQLLKWVANGEIPILIGTHSLIQKKVLFKYLALVIIDEQHRFGTRQRSRLVRKDSFAPHFLSMTATPIPRTLALTIFGDLDLTLIDEMPPGRKAVITEIVTPEKRGGAYEKIKEELKKGRQVFVICPRIDEPDPDKELALNVKSVKAEAKRLKKDVFKKEEIEILHGKMKKNEKEDVMKEFTDGDIDILVSTSVIEVGVNIPNATVIVIEGAERFGLAQLHQLRGRVLRSEHQAYCYIFSDSKSQKTLDRLKALKTAKNGFELSELDLELRGAGELTGAKQWGISDIGMEAIRNIKMVEAARTEAQEIIKSDPELENHLELKKALEERNLKIHFE